MTSALHKFVLINKKKTKKKQQIYQRIQQIYRIAETLLC